MLVVSCFKWDIFVLEFNSDRSTSLRTRWSGMSSSFRLFYKRSDTGVHQFTKELRMLFMKRKSTFTPLQMSTTGNSFSETVFFLPSKFTTCFLFALSTLSAQLLVVRTLNGIISSLFLFKGRHSLRESKVKALMIAMIEPSVSLLNGTLITLLKQLMAGH